MENKNQQNNLFTEEQINNFAGLGNTLKKIHLRLTTEGIIINGSEPNIISRTINCVTSGAVSGLVGSY